jgi:copper chaperone NosL
MRITLTATVLAALTLVACGEEDAPQVVSAPAPIEITRDDIGYYCNMIVADHLGPKGQVHIAIYVNDMGRASWEKPEAGTWIDARNAWFVVGSNKVGGMGAPEAVSFAAKTDAHAFAGKHGGQVVTFDGVPRDYVLNDASQSMQAGMHNGHGHSDTKVVK